MFSAARISALRKSKGLSQEVLAEQSGVSLRTIQRVEQGETVPRGHTVQALAAALEVPLEALRHEPEPAGAALPAPTPALVVAPALPDDPEFLQLLNLSALSFLVLPFLNLVVPWLLWHARRHSTAHVAALGRRVLGFQVLWQVGCFFAFMLAIGAQMVARHYYQVVLPGMFLGVLVLTYAVNVLTVVYYQRQLRQGRLDVYRFRL
ncbi:helix-turn-helix domain-containing protein [Hymenobacter sp. BT683]|uniref:Helix-turn-helix domain-containing protein n=1 Tax=Hymenobacter jeongseonensis TaxID=2791027 RepID=A0ABS0ICW7_9BACT|nr:helix-turn-helix domain-containing protein [Hymenobacter jeongseonensis]MBF9236196.1 helix-turn-helix domain-containing protein [Hymenobacter jeongseonensis]